MKAISIKYLPVTNTKGVRVKAYDLDNNQLTEPRDYSLGYQEQAMDLALKFIIKMKWDNVVISGIGSIKNGYVITLQNKPRTAYELYQIAKNKS